MTTPMSEQALRAMPRGARPPAPVGSRRGQSAPTRICFVGLQNLPVLSPAYGAHGIGGEQVQQSLLACALASRGFAVSMVVADYGQPDALTLRGVELFKAYRLEAGVPVLRFVHPRLTRLWAALARADADVYYASIAGPQVGIVALFALMHGRRFVFRIASDADCDPRRLLIRYARDRWLYAFGLRHAQVVLAQSVQQAQSMQANYGLQARLASMLVEPAGPWIPFEQRDIDVLWVGNMLPLKRPHWILDLARRVPELRIHIVGGAQPGHQALWDDVAAQARALANVHFHGRLAYHEVHPLFERTRVFVNTSEIEGFPNGFLQAWQRGTPVVSFFDPDHVIAAGGLGAAVTSMDELAHDAAHLAHSAGDWLAASARCRQYMADHHGEERVLEPYLQSLVPHGHANPGIAHPDREAAS